MKYLPPPFYYNPGGAQLPERPWGKRGDNDAARYGLHNAQELITCQHPFLLNIGDYYFFANENLGEDKSTPFSSLLKIRVVEVFKPFGSEYTKKYAGLEFCGEVKVFLVFP